MKLIGGREVNYNLFPKFHVRHEGFSFYAPRKSDEGADTDLIYNFCWSNLIESFLESALIFLQSSGCSLCLSGFCLQLSQISL